MNNNNIIVHRLHGRELIVLSYLSLPSRVLPSSLIYIICMGRFIRRRGPLGYLFLGVKKITACKDLNESGQLINSAFSSAEGSERNFVVVFAV